MRRGVRIAIDVGSRRVGIARSDSDGLMAVPVTTLERDVAITGIRSLIDEFDPIEIIVGLPLSLDGSETASTRDAREFSRDVASMAGRPVRVVDERLTTVSAQGALHAATHSTRTSRPMIDQVAAQILLDTVLTAERNGNTLGELVGVQ